MGKINPPPKGNKRAAKKFIPPKEKNTETHVLCAFDNCTKRLNISEFLRGKYCFKHQQQIRQNENNESL
jgi:hypothetical protein